MVEGFSPSVKWWLIVGTGLVLVVLALTYIVTGRKPLGGSVK